MHSPYSIAAITLLLFFCLSVILPGTNTLSATALTPGTRKPAEKIPSGEVIFATTQHRVLDFDTNNAASGLVPKLTTAAQTVATNARAAGLFSTRQQAGITCS